MSTDSIIMILVTIFSGLTTGLCGLLSYIFLDLRKELRKFAEAHTDLNIRVVQLIEQNTMTRGSVSEVDKRISRIEAVVFKMRE